MDGHSTADLGATLLGALIVFVATNIDDIVLVALLFAEPQLRGRSIVLGQFAGIGVLVLTSVLAGWAAVSVPARWVALLGVLPLGLGLWKGIALLRGRADHETDDEGLASPTPARASGVLEITAVAGVTLANGGDNLSVYIPLFASKPASIPVFSLVFAVMTALWCWLGHSMVQHRSLGEKLRRYGRVILPIVLIGLGIEVLLGAF